MWFVYVLRSRRDKDLYIGSTNDIQRRLAEHNSGMVESMRPRLPFDLEAYVAVRDKAGERTTFGQTGIKSVDFLVKMVNLPKTPPFPPLGKNFMPSERKSWTILGI